MSQQFRFLFGAMGRFFMLALIMAASTGLLFIDILVLKNDLGEDSVTEIVAEVMLLAVIVLLFRKGLREPEDRAGFFLIAGFFASMLIRELDQIFDYISHGAWFWFAVPVSLIAIIYAFLHPRTAVNGLYRFVSHPAYGMMVTGLLVVLVFSRLFGMGILWRGMMGDDFNRLAKNLAEEGCELLGYTLCLLSAIMFCRKQRVTAKPDQH
ncbi:hypothetical protein R4E38_01430 [Morganella morganii]|uniref:Uncharacterized protein n=1 Tax=Morganella morganii subsp. morganii KT TaxID=1124991 RepID=M1SNS5_MORMO|nr:MULTISPECIES: hypothetical protein [Morganella]AGG31471.1 hypothetical protein MU9_2426 [Morganella morganii subsp. morganii KT]MDK3099763.1 hypothetical protein [Morganella morganii]MDO7860865.1 hypothetical protein [Morganella morganii]MDW7785472.1 hypothetical protein [Morganella morganii]WPU20544.1 hypothetical protein SPN40_09325 [Morganella morganii]